MAIFISIFVMLAFLFCSFSRSAGTGETENYEDGVFSYSLGKGETNWIFLRLIVVTLALCYPISMFLGQSVPARPCPLLSSVTTQGFFVALALAGLAIVVLLELGGLPRALFVLKMPMGLNPWKIIYYVPIRYAPALFEGAFSRVFYIMLAIVISIPMVALFMVQLRKWHPAVFAIITVILGGLFIAALLWIYYSRPLMPLSYFGALTLGTPLFALLVLRFNKTMLVLYGVFLFTLLFVCNVPWNLRHSFLRDLNSVKRGMTFAEVEKIMEKYPYRKGFRSLNNFSVKCFVPDDGNVVPLAAGPNHLVVVKSDGSLAAWGRKQSGECDVPAGSDFVAVGVGCSYSVALKSDGSIVAWGSNNSGRCDVPTGNNYVAIAAGYSHVVTLKSDGSLVAWGRNDAGQCNVPDGNNFTAISAGGRHSLALRSDGSLVAWGSNGAGQCNVPEGKDFVAIAAGGSHSLALKSNGSLMAWSSRFSGWWDIPPGRNFVAIAAGVEHNVALRSDGSLVAWGNNIYGQCNVPTGKEFVAITAGWYESAALVSDGSLVIWGSPYTTSIGGFENRHKSELVNGTVLYHYDDDTGNSDVGRVRFRDGRVESVIFWPD